MHVNGNDKGKGKEVESSSDSEDVVIGYLGPEGSYSHQAAKRLSEVFVPPTKAHVSPIEISLEPYPCIQDVWDSSQSGRTTHIVLPLRNTIHGPVKETILCLTSASSRTTPHANGSTRPNDIGVHLHCAKSNGKQEGTNGEPKRGHDAAHFEEEFEQPYWRIVDALTLQVSHALVVKKGTKLEEIKWVKSHEQALGQCANYLSSRLPHARRIPVESTATAARSLVDDAEFPEPGPSERPKLDNGVAICQTKEDVGAAICSSSIVDAIDGLEVLAKAIQNVAENYTEFILCERRHRTNGQRFDRVCRSSRCFWIPTDSSEKHAKLASRYSSRTEHLVVSNHAVASPSNPFPVQTIAISHPAHSFGEEIHGTDAIDDLEDFGSLGWTGMPLSQFETETECGARDVRLDGEEAVNGLAAIS